MWLGVLPLILLLQTALCLRLDPLSNVRDSSLQAGETAETLVSFSISSFLLLFFMPAHSLHCLSAESSCGERGGVLFIHGGRACSSQGVCGLELEEKQELIRSEQLSRGGGGLPPAREATSFVETKATSRAEMRARNDRCRLLINTWLGKCVFGRENGAAPSSGEPAPTSSDESSGTPGEESTAEGANDGNT